VHLLVVERSVFCMLFIFDLGYHALHNIFHNVQLRRRHERLLVITNVIESMRESIIVYLDIALVKMNALF
jgi:hypothetical protein